MVTFCANVYGPLDRGMVMLQLCCGKFSHKELCSKLYFIEVDFFPKNEKIVFWATLSGLRGNVRTLPISRWKARGRLYIRHNRTFFAVFYGWDIISRNRSKLAFFKGGGSLSANIWQGRGHCPPANVDVRKLEWLPFCVVSKYPQYII